MRKKNIVKSLAAISSFSALMVALPAHAEFKFVPPEPVVIEQAPVSRATTVQPPLTIMVPPNQDASGVVPLQPSAIGSADGVLSPPSSSQANFLDAKDKAVVGFANNVPLSVALRQILPPQYSWNIASGVSDSTTVSWQGGAGWREVLKGALAPVGLQARDDGLVVSVSRVSSADVASKSPSIVSPSVSARSDKVAVSPVVSAPVKDVELLPVVASKAPSSVSFVQPQSVVSGGAVNNSSVTQKAEKPFSDSSSKAAALSVEVWSAERGASLHALIESWTQRAGVELNWMAEYDYPIQASVSFTGTFEDAVRGVLSGFREAQPQPIASLYNNESAGNRVLVVKVRGNNYSE